MQATSKLTGMKMKLIFYVLLACTLLSPPIGATRFVNQALSIGDGDEMLLDEDEAIRNMPARVREAGEGDWTSDHT
eukprot:scaffold231804_cov79-Attheya_sp.AAC.1